ncbi:MAG: AraC family transcriptional regulator [Lachnospiraceae bacterium]|nr:AraC family transcriptional regulator [Lachnospiraceae bacterium]
MRNIDFAYMAENIANLSRIAIRIYEDNNLIVYNDPSRFPKDPAKPFIDKLLQIKAPISYYLTPYDHFYGIITYENIRIIIGPTFQMTPTRDKIREFMFSLDIKLNYLELYNSFTHTITPMPLEMFLHELSLVYYFISEQKIRLSDIIIYDSNNKSYEFESYKNKVSAYTNDNSETEELTNSFNELVEAHTTSDFEGIMLSLIRVGDIDGLKELFSNTSAGRAGKTASSYLRNIKNLFISTATLVSRAAIDGGLFAEEALTLSDKYIQHAEKYDNYEQIMNLQFNMIMDFASRVQEITYGKRYNKFVRSITSYVREHLTEEINIDNMADELFISRSYLSSKFKKETGITLSQYIQEQRIKKAQELLKSSNKSILEISTFLGFSSQGYFQNVFKKIVGMTPREYRMQ